jgi:hypothetical protein
MLCGIGKILTAYSMRPSVVHEISHYQRSRITIFLRDKNHLIRYKGHVCGRRGGTMDFDDNTCDLEFLK